MNIRRIILCYLLLCVHALMIHAQYDPYQDGNGDDFDTEDNDMPYDNRSKFIWGRDTTENEHKEIPIGQFQWKLEQRLGTMVDAENADTVVHNFQNFPLTEGYTGQYSFLGNAGAPRMNRIFTLREENENFVFMQPFSYLRGNMQEFRFTNTLSPITNLAYHKCGNRENGQDRVRAWFASNINKYAGIGFKADYLYARGYYNNQQNSEFGGILYGYYRGDRYNMHAYAGINHFRMGENGGIEDERYITNPQSFQQNYGTRDIPVNLSDTWNQNHEELYYLSHRYNVGFTRDIEVADSAKPKAPDDVELLSSLPDSIREVYRNDTIARQKAIDSLRTRWQEELITPKEFMPVTSFIHTLDIQRMKHIYLSHNTPDNYYKNLYYGGLTDIEDPTKGLSVRNTLAVALREGFNKWAQMGISLYASHKLRTYTLPEPGEIIRNKSYKENDISVGGVLNRTQGKWIHYNVDAELWLIGKNTGDFRVNGDMDLEFKISKRDTMRLDVEAEVSQETPGFYFRHFSNRFTQWDLNLSRQITSKVMGHLSLERTKTRLSIGVENMKNYTFFAIQNTRKEGAPVTGNLPSDFLHDVGVNQHSGNVQVFTAMLNQDFKFGPVGWENEVAYQKTSNKDVLPLPQVSLYSNLYLLFRIARVLRVQIGGDIRYFTSYYAPDYAPSIGQFAVQDATYDRTKIGNYPMINVYANLHLKHCRLYVTCNHVNSGTGRSFWAPYYPVDPRTIHFGVSWNFFN